MVESLLTSQFKGERLELAAAGSWTAANAGELETLVDRVAGEAAQAKNVSIDMAGVREFDTFGAWLLERLTRAWSLTGREPVIVAEHGRADLQDPFGDVRAVPEFLRPFHPVVDLLD